MPITPIFVLSVPRSGSTLVQRVVAAHRGIATAAEPWLLLPLLGPLEPDNAMTDAWQHEIAKAIEDFAGELPGGEDEMLAEIRALVMRLYERAGGPDAQFFVDKTPHYYLVVDLVLRTFPDARFVFLWRNPLSTVSSFVDTFGDGRWCMSKYRLQLFHGINDLVSAYRRHADRVHAVRYEDLLMGRGAWEAMMAHIGVEFEPAALERFHDVQLSGRMQDRNGARYEGLSAEPLNKYERTLASPVRQAWCRRYLRWLGQERLTTMGYDLDELLAILDAVPRAFDTVLDDVVDLAHAAGREMWRARMPGNRLASSMRTLATASA